MTEHFPSPLAVNSTPAKRRRWPWILGIVAAVVVGAVVGSVAQTDPLGDRTAAVAQREKDAAAVEQALDSRGAQLDRRTDTLDQISSSLDQRSSQIREREDALLPKEQEAAKNVIAGDGIYLVGKDINPGTYRNGGTSGCYWKRSSGTSGDFGEILANGNESGPAVVTIESSDVAFTSKRCGQWALVN